MLKYAGKRLITALFTVFFSFMLTFFLMRFSPGNPIRMLAGKDNPNPEQIQYLTEKYGLDQPYITQFFLYIKNTVSGDFGVAYRSNQPALKLIGERVSPTLILTLTASVLSVLAGTLLGLFCGRRIGSLIDRLLCKISYIIDALPVFWLAMVLVLIFAVRLRLFPTSGMRNLREEYTGFRSFLDLIHHLFLPVLTIVIVQTPIYFRIARASVMQVLNEKFILTFRAAGLSEQKIFNKYVLKSSIIPVVTAFGLSLAFLISGAALIEIVFAWPGMGRLILDSVNGREYQVLTAVYLLISISVAVFGILTDILYALIVPRIRLK